MQFVVHYFLHFIFPGFIAWFCYREKWISTYIIFIATMLVDLDHLTATPVYQACRCSIGFHPLHSYIACGVYALMLFFKRTRIIAIGLLMHMATDGLDCWWSSLHCR